ncbi:HAD family hydrolase [Paenibacillus ferrarius]|uniref:HAD family hydrolase n=1 Tax=Paenibacillus ferrarius TaxID=1469647 RepID=UPI003D2DB809
MQGDTELWKTDMYLTAIQLKDIDLLCLDIFDTLYFRMCSQPADLFGIAAGKAHTHGTLAASIAPEAFQAMRMEAERRARERERARTGFGEVTLPLIYADMPETVCDREALIDIELETEAEYGYLNPHIVSLMKACRERDIPVALVSDMYLLGDQLRYLLASNGLDLTLIHSLWVSSEEGDGKSSGYLFEKVKAHYSHIASGRMLHIGDNRAADVDGAAKAGIRSVYYGVIPESFANLHHWEQVRHGQVLPAWKSLRKLAGAASGRMAVQPGSAGQFFYSFGAQVLGPFLQALCEWVLDLCEAEGIGTVHPLMREAYLLGPMLERAASLRGMTLEVKPVYVSRQAVLLAGMSSFGERERDQLLGIHGVKVHELWEVLELQEEAAAFASWQEVEVAECRTVRLENGETVYDLIVKRLSSESVERRMAQTIQAHRSRFITYLEQQFGDPASLVTLDIGFNGTMQQALERIVALAGGKPRMRHLLAVGADRLDALRMSGMDVRSMLRAGSGGCEEGDRIARTPAFLEELLMGNFGSTLRYREEENGLVTPVTAALKRSEEELALKAICQEGAFAFQRYYAYLLAHKGAWVPRASREAIRWTKPLHRVLDMPMLQEAQELGDLIHQDNFVTEHAVPICEELDERWYADGAEAFLLSCNYGQSVLNAYWPQGLATRKFPSYLYGFNLRHAERFGRKVMLFEVIEQVKAAGFEAVALYGGGGFAEEALKLLWFHGFTTPLWIDPQREEAAEPWGDFKYATLAQLAERADQERRIAIVIAELSEMGAHRRHVEQALQGQEATISIFAV